VNAARAAPPLVIAHRGASGERPENTLPAYALAVEQSADMIEIDLHRTRDGAIVVAHDEHLPGLPGGRAIGECSLAEVRGLSTGDGRVPSLEEVLDAFGALIAFNLEIKRGATRAYPGIEAQALAAIEARGIAATILFSSFDQGVLKRVREAAPAARIGVLVAPREQGRWLERCQEVGAEAVHFWKAIATERTIARAHRAGLAVLAYTVDEPREMRALLGRGCDGLFTNFPARMRALLDRDPLGGRLRDRPE